MLGRTILHRRAIPSNRSFSSANNALLCNAWQLSDKHRNLLGPRTVIVSGFDDKSKELSQRMWFEMQRVGIQSSFITMTTPYPVLSNLQEAVSLFRRTGAKSIVTLGNGAVADFGKAMRASIETGLSVPQLLARKAGTKRETVPLLCAGSGSSLVPFLPSFRVLHAEDDVLVSSSWRAPDVIASDPSLSALSPYQNKEISSVAAFSVVLDSLFVLAFQEAIKDPQLDIEALRLKLNERISSFSVDLSKLLSIRESTIPVDPNQSEFIKALGTVAELREKTASFSEIGANYWPGVIEITAMLSALNPKQDLSLPYSFHIVKSFSAVFEKVLTDPDQYFRAKDKQIVKALQAALMTSAELLSMENTDALKQRISLAAKDMEVQCKTHPKLFVRKLNTSNEVLTSAGHLEKIMTLLDLEEEQHGALPGSNSLKDVLQSDVMVDMVEHVI